MATKKKEDKKQTDAKKYDRNWKTMRTNGRLISDWH